MMKLYIYHIPISLSKFLYSIEKRLGNSKISEEMTEGINLWKKDEGGVWDLEIYDIIRITNDSV